MRKVHGTFVSTTMRAVVIMESLVDGILPEEFTELVSRRYGYVLDGTRPVEIAELTVPRERVPDVSFRLADALLPSSYYAHLLDAESMMVVFPQAIVRIGRGDQRAAANAQAIGARVGIPSRQMSGTVIRTRLALKGWNVVATHRSHPPASDTKPSNTQTASRPRGPCGHSRQR